MNQKQRERRDETSARAAIAMAIEHKRKPAIAVDNDICVERMVERVKRIATSQSLSFDIEKAKTGVYVRFPHKDAGSIYIFAADKLTGNPSN
ncbi:hypothetical protein Rctr197k_279 [Virus Rctr197k]|nr:hypothetical protein Rctr197k_279 [Virus Rctr197k]